MQSETFANMDATHEVVLKNLATFVAFARKRVGDPHLAEDLVQESLVKALGADRKPSEEADTLAWFYRILRHAVPGGSIAATKGFWVGFEAARWPHMSRPCHCLGEGMKNP